MRTGAILSWVVLLVASPTVSAQQLFPRSPDPSRSDELVQIATYQAVYAEVLPAAVRARTAEQLSRLMRQSTTPSIRSFGSTLPDPSVFQSYLQSLRSFDMQSSGIELQTEPSIRQLDQALSQTSLPAADILALQIQARATAQQLAQADADAAATEAANSQVAQPLVARGAAWQETIVLGFASYLAKRAEAEALTSMVQVAGKHLCDDTSRWIVPSTCLQIAGSGEYPPAWSTLRFAVAKDISALPDSLISRGMTAQNPEFAELARVGIRVVRLLESGEDPVWTLIGLRHTFACSPTCMPNTARAYLYAVGHAIEFIGRDPTIAASPGALSTAADSLIRILRPVFGEEAYADIDAQKILLAGVLEEMARQVTRLREIQRNPQISADPKLYSQYLLTTWGLGRAALRLAPTEVDSALMEQFYHADRVVKGSISAIERIRAKDYSGAYVELQLIAFQVFPVASMPKLFSSYGPMLAQLASADSPEAVQQTLQAAAAPVGSHRGKKGSGARSYGVNAFVGGQGGFEWVAADPNESHTQGGLFAPVGFEASFGFGGGGSLGLFMSIADLGALMTVRSGGSQVIDTTSDRTVESGAEIGFKQVLAPGIFITLGVTKHLPVTLGTGVSVHPDLRRVTGEGSVESTSTKRWILFAAADMPIFRF